MDLNNAILEDVSAEDEPISSDEDNFTIKAKDNPFSLPLRIDSFACEKDMNKFIKCVERQVRSSVEYKYWVKYVTEALGHSTCALTNEVMGECTIEIHHHPIPLYTVCKGVIMSQLNGDQKVCTFDISTNVIEKHFQNKVGYIPLISDLHEKYHAGFQDLPIELVNGNYKDLIATLPFEEDEVSRIEMLEGIHLNDCSTSWSKGNYPGLDVKLVVNQ